MNPFIPLEKANTVIVSGNISDEIYRSLKALNLRIIKTIPHKKVHSSIKYHPDIVINAVDRNLLIVEPSVYDYYKEEFKGTNIELIKGEKYLDLKYPSDISYNVARVGNLAVHNFKYIDELLKFHLEKTGLDLVNVNQGYTKCSMAIIGNTDIITADTFIDKTLREFGINSLLIKPGAINLENQEYGFIGGCTGNISNREVLLSGKLTDHPDRQRIENFIRGLNKQIIYLSKEMIVDIGTIIALNCN